MGDSCDLCVEQHSSIYPTHAPGGGCESDLLHPALEKLAILHTYGRKFQESLTSQTNTTPTQPFIYLFIYLYLFYEIMEASVKS